MQHRLADLKNNEAKVTTESSLSTDTQARREIEVFAEEIKSLPKDLSRKWHMNLMNI